MSKFICSFLVLLALNARAGTCVDFSGIYFEGGNNSLSASCTIIEQTDCVVSKQTLYLGPFPAGSVEFTTDGVLRRYSIEPSMQKAISYDASGNMIFLGIDDDGTRVEGIYEKISNGDIHSTSNWIKAGQTEINRGVFHLTASLNECLALKKSSMLNRN